MKKPSTSDSDDETENSAKSNADQTSGDDEDDETDNEPLLPRPKSFATNIKSDDDDDDDEEEEESKKESIKSEELDESSTEDTLNLKPIKMNDDTDEDNNEETDTLSEKIVRQTKSKWSLSNSSSEDETSEDALSNSSLTELLEDQIQSWYQEDGLKRPRRLPKALYDSMLQDGIDISDLSLDKDDTDKLTADTAKIKNLSLDDLISKINFYD